MMKKSLLIPVVIMFIILAVLLVFMALPFGQTSGQAVEGRLDLRKLDDIAGIAPVDIDGSIYQLTGEWQCTPKRLVTPAEFPDDAPYVDLPVGWGRDDAFLNTFATYRLQVLVDDVRFLTLFLPEIYSAYNLWVNGEYMQGAGVVADNPIRSVPGFESVLIPVKAQDGRVEILIQASDFHFLRPSMSNLVLFGESDLMHSWFFRTRTLYILALGFIFAAAFYHIALYVLRHKDFIYLLFSFLCAISFMKFSLDTNGMSDFTGWISTRGILDKRLFIMLFFLYLASILVFSLYVFDWKWLYRYRWWVSGYLVFGTITFGFIPLNVLYAPYFMVVATLPVTILTIVRVARSRLLRESRIMWLYVTALVLCPLVEYLNKCFFDHVFYMTGLIANIYLIMAHSMILSMQYAQVVAKEQELSAKTAAMEQAAQMRSHMIDTLSHEVRTPLTVMSTYAQLAVERITEGKMDEQTLLNLKNISGEAKRLADFAVNTLRLSRLSGTDAGAGLAPINVSELAEQVTQLFRPVAKKTDRNLTLFLPQNPPFVFGSADSLTRLLWNLLDNALTHSDYGDIEVKVLEDGDKVCLFVEDYGRGIPPELMPRVFERGISGSEEGTGLGLDMCRGIAHELHGTITLDSVLGEGLTVTLLLPAYRGGI